MMVLSCTFERLEVDLFKALKKLDVLEVDRDSNDVYSFTLVSNDKDPKQGTLTRSFDDLEGLTVKELAQELKKEFKKMEKSPIVTEEEARVRSDEELTHYVVARSFQYYEMGEPVSWIPKYIQVKQELSRKVLRYLTDNLDRQHEFERFSKKMKATE
ncbi:hypothetical protein GLW03_12925 [Halobacillus halophilus]|uniref:hypothetical protein n=1 Tax=Halobacillus halophilus TaxID=1570 RepID=UPI00136AB0BC|nr:hypothetical protein [Halobacillus halophilus]MYL30729.1 hypothetical protein [Halobacillus halophilus]